MNRLAPKKAKKKLYECAAGTLDGTRLEGVEFMGGDTWFPRGAITVLGGRKRSGKSTLCLYECAKFSAAGKHVLIVQQEDPEGLLRAKLECMGAGMSNILVFRRRRIIGDGTALACAEDEFDNRNIGDIIKLAEQTRADLVYIDPLHALASGHMNDQQSADCMLPLRALAQRTGCCVLGVLHAHKNPKDVQYAMSGTDQWVAKARSYLYLETDPNDTDIAICQQVDASYSEPYNAKVEFSVEKVRGDDGWVFPARIVKGVSPTNDTAQDYLDIKNSMRAETLDPVVRDEIAEWAHSAVRTRDGHVLAKELLTEAKARGWSPASLRKAYAKAGIGQAKEAARAPRSILYLTDPSEYDGTVQQLFRRGKTPKQLAKEWCGTLPR